jgi:hypothetical protein
MKRMMFKKIIVLIVSLLLLSAQSIAFAQPGQEKTGAPPVGQPLVTEGVFAVSLVSALSLRTTDDEVVAESQLGDLGIIPRNGWIADYPVTPDIFVELQNAVINAAEAGKLSMGRDEALKKLNDVAVNFSLPLRPYTAGENYEPSPSSCQVYPNPMEVNNSYTSEGPPVVTYYCPPPDYYYLYEWVPSPFWWSDLWFPGFFILHDFHRIVHVHRKVAVVTNHFNAFKTHQAFRIDPVDRFRGRTFGGIGASRQRHFIPTGIPRSERTIFNGPQARKAFSGTMSSPASRGGVRTAPSSGARRVNPFSFSGGGGSIQRGGRR